MRFKSGQPMKTVCEQGEWKFFLGGATLTRLCTSERCYSLQRVEYILYALPNVTAATIVPAIQDTLAQLNLALNKARGQYYNGASTMRGLKYMLL